MGKGSGDCNRPPLQMGVDYYAEQDHVGEVFVSTAKKPGEPSLLDYLMSGPTAANLKYLETGSHSDEPSTQSKSAKDTSSETQTFYHGTTNERAEQILQEGLKGQNNRCAYVTDSQKAAMMYARQACKENEEPVVLKVILPRMKTQPNGSCAPPFFCDDWHSDSGMPGNAWEYDAPIGPECIEALNA